MYGQATTGGVISTTGVAGLTLGGGLGWLMGKYGLAIDNVAPVEVVTADGQVRIVNAEDEPDLFWALRGGGGNFGVAASFEFETHPLDDHLRRTASRFPLADAPEVFDFFREFTADAARRGQVFCGLVHAPDGCGMKIVRAAACAIAATWRRPRRTSPPLRAFGPRSWTCSGRCRTPS